MVSFTTLLNMIDLIKLIFVLILMVLVTKIITDIINGNKGGFFLLFLCIGISFFILSPINTAEADLTLDSNNQVLSSETRDNQTIFLDDNTVDYFFNDCNIYDSNLVVNFTTVFIGEIYFNNTNLINCSIYANNTGLFCRWLYSSGGGKTRFINCTFYEEVNYIFVANSAEIDIFNSTGKFSPFLRGQGIYRFSGLLDLTVLQAENDNYVIYQYSNLTISTTYDYGYIGLKNVSSTTVFIPIVKYYQKVINIFTFNPIIYNLTFYKSGFFAHYDNLSFETNDTLTFSFITIPSSISVTINVFDSLSNPLNNVTVSITEQNNTNGYFSNFNQSNIFTIQSGTYYIHVSKYLFETQNYLIILSSDLTVNIYLDFNDTLDYDKELIDYEIALLKAANQENNNIFTRQLFFMGVSLILVVLFIIILMRYK